MQQLDLGPIKARLEVRTPGPWRVVKGGPTWEVIAGTEAAGYHAVCTTGSIYPRDAELIANAPADLEALIDEVERLTRERDQAREAIRSAVKGWPALDNDDDWAQADDEGDIIEGLRHCLRNLRDVPGVFNPSPLTGKPLPRVAG